MNRKLLFSLIGLFVAATMLLSACSLGQAKPVLPDGNFNQQLCINESKVVEFVLHLEHQIQATSLGINVACTRYVTPGGDYTEYVASKFALYIKRKDVAAADRIDLDWNDGVAKAILPFPIESIESVEAYWSDLGPMSVVQFDGGFSITLNE